MTRALAVCSVLLGGFAAFCGCYSTPIDTTDYAQGPAPLRERSPAAAEGASYEDCLDGGRIFTMYCGACHNARSLAERPFSNYKNAAAHMRVRANMTGQEYAKLMAWMRRWHDVAPPHPPVEPSPKRFFFSQPINELRDEPPAAQEDGTAEPDTVPSADDAEPK